jgi:tetratricopeptide (TPR) repeat protein
MAIANRKILQIIIFSLIVGLQFVSAETISRLNAAGDSLYSIYEYSASANYYEDALKIDSLDFESNWKLSRSLNIVGELAPKDSQLAIFESARDAAARAIRLNNNHADSRFQLARALGKIALFKGIFKSASLAKQVKREAEAALAIDSLHDGAFHILGRWHREVGKKPKIIRSPMGLGAANKEDAMHFMIRAVAINPNLIHHRLEMGITYEEFGYKKEAISEYNRCLEIKSLSPLDFKYSAEAKKLLAELKKSD